MRPPTGERAGGTNFAWGKVRFIHALPVNYASAKPLLRGLGNHVGIDDLPRQHQATCQYQTYQAYRGRKPPASTSVKHLAVHVTRLAEAQ